MKTLTRAEADREAYLGYVTAELAKFREHAGVHSFVWDAEKLQRARRLAPMDTSDEGVFVGPWRVVRSYVTTEYREYVEQYYASRMTFSEWKARAVAERAAEAQRQSDYLDSAEYCTDSLADLRSLFERRDELIVTARERGASWGDIGDAIGLSRAQLHNIATRHAVKMRNAVASVEQHVSSVNEDVWDEDSIF